MINFHHFGDCALVSDGTLTDEQIGKIGDFILKVTKPAEDKSPFDNLIALFIGADKKSICGIDTGDNFHTFKEIEGYMDNYFVAKEFIQKMAADIPRLTRIESAFLYVDISRIDVDPMISTDNSVYLSDEYCNLYFIKHFDNRDGAVKFARLLNEKYLA